MIIFYFFLGGISGAAYTLASMARLFGGRDGAAISRVGYYLSFATLIPSPVLLILDLKKPSRFLNMLRIVKLRSPMSLGVWILMTFSAFSTLSALNQAAKDGLLPRRGNLRSMAAALPSGAIGAAGTLPALMLSGYTGVLLAATAVPLWTKSYRAMGPLFLASAVSNAAAAMTLALAMQNGSSSEAIKRLEKIDSIALVAESGLLSYMQNRAGKTIGKPLREGTTGKLLTFGFKAVGVAVPVLVQASSALLGKQPPRQVTMAASTLVLVGGFVFRYVMVVGGNQSADDPHATFEMTRMPIA